jgi:hypothetical protein
MQKAWKQLPWWPVPTVGRIPSVLGHGRLRGAGQKKEDDEGIRFHTLLTAGVHLGGRISPEKLRRRFCPAFVPGRRRWVEVASRGGGHGCRGRVPL